MATRARNRIQRRLAARRAKGQLPKKIPRRTITGARGFKLKAKFVAVDEKARMDAAGALFDHAESFGVAIGGTADFSSGELGVWCERGGGETTDDDRTRVLAFILSHAELFSDVEVQPLELSPYVQGAAPSPPPDMPPPSDEPEPPTA